MKNLIIFILCLFTLTSFSQQFDIGEEGCWVDPNGYFEEDITFNKTLRSDFDTLKIPINFINYVYFDTLRNELKYGLKPGDIDKTIEYYNSRHNRIVYRYGDSTGVFLDDPLIDYLSYRETQDILDVEKEDHYNLHVPERVTAGNVVNIAGLAEYPWSNRGARGFVEAPYSPDGSTGTHEAAHAFGLYHVHEGFQCDTLCDEIGDKVCDTKPTTANRSMNFGCVEIGFRLDDCGDTVTANLRNIMSFSQKQCRDTFTVGQEDRMIEMAKIYYPNIYYGNLTTEVKEIKKPFPLIVSHSLLNNIYRLYSEEMITVDIYNLQGQLEKSIVFQGVKIVPHSGGLKLFKVNDQIKLF